MSPRRTKLFLAVALIAAGCASSDPVERDALPSPQTPLQLQFTEKDWHGFESVQFVRSFRLEDYSRLLVEPLDASSAKLPPASDSTYEIARTASKRADLIMIHELRSRFGATLVVAPKKPVPQRLAAAVDYEQQIKELCGALKSPRSDEVLRALSQLRDMDAPEAAPEILPCLANKDENVVRDACRTLAVLGNEATISSIEPFLNDPRIDVQREAQGAVAKLRSKPSAGSFDRTLIFRGKILEIDPGSKALRIWVGGGSGLPTVRIGGEMMDAKSGETLLRFERSRVGSESLRKAGYDSNLDYCFEVLADDLEYLLKLYE